MIYVIRDTNLKEDDTNCFLTQYNVTTSKYSDTECRRAIVFGNLDNARRFLYMKDAVEVIKEMNCEDNYWGGLCVMKYPNAEYYVRKIKTAANTPDLPEEEDDKEIYVIESLAMGGRTDCFVTDISINDTDDGCSWRVAYDYLEHALEYDTEEEALIVAERVNEVAPEDHVQAVTLEQAKQSVKLWLPATTNPTERDGKYTSEGEIMKTDKVDIVNHPSHYETGKFECIEVMEEIYGREDIKTFCRCNAFKYLYRCKNKNGNQDIDKARWYINKYLDLCKEDGDDPNYPALLHDVMKAYKKYDEEKITKEAAE